MTTTTRRSTIEILLAGIALASAASFGACGGTTDEGSGTGGSSGASGGASSGASSGASGQVESCTNGKDPLCGCRLPAEATQTHDYRGPPAFSADAGDDADAGADGGMDAPDAAPWACQDECRKYHPNPNATFQSCELAPSSAPQKVTCTYYVRCVGRRPAELEEAVLETTEARELLSETAKLEAASIDAFVRLARELAHHRAPAALVARAREAARDERRHTGAMRSLAARFGADPADSACPPSRTRRVPRLADVLLENAVEGCVRETFGALMAHVQALRAADPVVRRTMAEVAVDESRHSALAWAVHTWGVTQVSARDRQRIEAAREAAVRTLVDEIARGPREVHEPELGLVGAREAGALAASLQTTLWS